MADNKIDPKNDSPIDEDAKIQEALKPLGFTVRAYKKKRRTLKIILDLDRYNVYIKL
jgi:ribosome maturation protein Sdo1